MYNLSNICKAANTLIKKGYSKSEAFHLAKVSLVVKEVESNGKTK